MRHSEAVVLGHQPLVISIDAGVPISFLVELAPGCAIVRAMPITPCAIGKRATVDCGGPGAKATHLDLARRTLRCQVAVLDLDEKHMDTVMELGGSGLAFTYLVQEAMAKGAVIRGRSQAVPLKLAARVPSAPARYCWPRAASVPRFATTAQRPSGAGSPACRSWGMAATIPSWPGAWR